MLRLGEALTSAEYRRGELIQEGQGQTQLLSCSILGWHC